MFRKYFIYYNNQSDTVTFGLKYNTHTGLLFLVGFSKNISVIEEFSLKFLRRKLTKNTHSQRYKVRFMFKFPSNGFVNLRKKLLSCEENFEISEEVSSLGKVA